MRELQTGVWPSEIDELAAGRETATVPTCPWPGAPTDRAALERALS